MDIIWYPKTKEIIFNHFGFNSIHKLPTECLTNPKESLANLNVAHLDLEETIKLRDFIARVIDEKNNLPQK